LAGFQDIAKNLDVAVAKADFRCYQSPRWVDTMLSPEGGGHAAAGILRALGGGFGRNGAMTVTEAKPGGEPIPDREKVLRWGKVIQGTARADAYDVATLVLVAALVVTALCTFKDYAISNDEGVQHRYGELIIAYYTSGFADQSVFKFQNLYLYGGLFDVIAVILGHLIPIDPYDLRHILCALIGIAGIGAAAAIARLISGSRAALIAAVALSASGVWYGAMFNHTKDIPFAAAMTAATLFLIRIARRLPAPRAGDVAAFGLLAGAALGIRVLGLLLMVYAGVAIALYLPRPGSGHARWRFAIHSMVRLLPALLLAYGIMILAWPWAALAPLNPIRGLLTFSEFHYGIRTVVDGQVYEMANVPRLYVPIYILIRMPLLALFGAALAMAFAILPRLAAGSTQLQRKDIALVALTVIIPLLCEVIVHGPAFTGLRHFLFVVPALAILAGVGLDLAVTALATRGRLVASGGLAVVTACFVWNAVTLVRLHPYEYLFYNSAVGGLEGASRRYDLDYWFSSMPEALGVLESYLRRSEPVDADRPTPVYSVAVCGERLPFEKTVTLPQLHWDFKAQWNQSEFFIAPTHMNCDGDLDGKIIGTVERLGIPIAYVKDRRALIRPTATAAR
jgi:Dolichyl-phosphate-mannose-protein mannosyltransferase